MEELQERTIHLYGVGKRGKVAFDNLSTMQLENNIKAFLDDNSFLDNDEYCGRRIHSLEQIHDLDGQDAIYIIITYTVNAMSCKLMEKGIPLDKIYFS